MTILYSPKPLFKFIFELGTAYVINRSEKLRGAVLELDDHAEQDAYLAQLAGLFLVWMNAEEAIILSKQ
jgi:hypothetical protein